MKEKTKQMIQYILSKENIHNISNMKRLSKMFKPNNDSLCSLKLTVLTCQYIHKTLSKAQSFNAASRSC